jgi:hypothetical protein
MPVGALSEGSGAEHEEQGGRHGSLLVDVNWEVRIMT